MYNYIMFNNSNVFHTCFHTCSHLQSARPRVVTGEVKMTTELSHRTYCDWGSLRVHGNKNVVLHAFQTTHICMENVIFSENLLLVSKSFLCQTISVSTASGPPAFSAHHPRWSLTASIYKLIVIRSNPWCTQGCVWRSLFSHLRKAVNGWWCWGLLIWWKLAFTYLFTFVYVCLCINIYILYM